MNHSGYSTSSHAMDKLPTQMVTSFLATFNILMVSTSCLQQVMENLFGIMDPTILVKLIVVTWMQIAETSWYLIMACLQTVMELSKHNASNLYYLTNKL